jgi:hypothetical protein
MDRTCFCEPELQNKDGFFKDALAKMFRYEHPED